MGLGTSSIWSWLGYSGARVSWIEELHKDSNKKLGVAPIPCINYRLTTPSTQLNCALGGGLPGGRTIEVIGDAAAGKTSSVASWCAIVQRMGGFVWWADAETKFDMNLGALTGLNYDSAAWRYDNPDNLEQYQTQLEANIRLAVGGQNKVKDPPPAMFVLDSLAALGIKAISEKKVDKQALRPMSAAQQWTHFFQREVPKMLMGSNIYLVFINHIRDNPDTLGYGQKPEFKSPGGKMVKFMETIRIFVKCQKFAKSSQKFAEIWAMEDKDSEYGYMVQYYVEKNSAGPPWRKAEIPFFFHRGFDDYLGSLHYLTDKGIIAWRGGHYWLDDLQFRSYPEILKKLCEDPTFGPLLQKYAALTFQTRNTYTADDFLN